MLISFYPGMTSLRLNSTIKIDAFVFIRSNDKLAAAEISENTVSITEGKTTFIKTKYQGLSQSSNRQQLSVDYSIKVPKELAYDIRNKFGDIGLDDLSGDIEVEAEFGNVEIEDFQGDLQVENSQGEVRIKDITGKAVINNEHGQTFFISSDSVTQDISIFNRHGNLTIELPFSQQGVFRTESRFGQIILDGFASSQPEEIEPNKQRWNQTIGTDSPNFNFNGEYADISITAR